MTSLNRYIDIVNKNNNNNLVNHSKSTQNDKIERTDQSHNHRQPVTSRQRLDPNYYAKVNSVKVEYKQSRRLREQQEKNNNAIVESDYDLADQLTRRTSNDDQQLNAERRDELVARIKRELSLTNDTLIPEQFITKRLSLCNLNDFDRSKQIDEHHRTDEKSIIRHQNESTTTRASDLITINGILDKRPNRTNRRQSLYELGFGQLSTYQKIKVIGSGSYSSVYKGTSRLTNKLVALKEISLLRDEGVPFTAIREVSLLKELKHANIITLHDYICTKKYLTLVFEYMDYDLSTYMGKCDYEIKPDNIRLFLFQLLRGLKYCHDRRVLHRDLKPQNLLLNQTGELKLADFGLARAKSVPIRTLTDEVVTLWYRPPDVLLGNTDYGPSIDMWGVGCIFFEMATGRTLFTGGDPDEQLEGILRRIDSSDFVERRDIKRQLISRGVKIRNSGKADFSHLEPRLGKTGIDLLKGFLKCEPDRRLSAKDAMKHQYFNVLPDSVHQLSNSQSIFNINTLKRTIAL